MKKLFFLAGIFFAALAGAQPTIVNDANAQARTLNAGFHALKVSGAIDVYMSQSESEAIAVSASEDKYRDNIKTVVENGTLKIFYESGLGWSTGNKKLKVYVSFKQLDNIEANGASDVHVAGAISANKLNLNLTGASEFKGAVAVSELNMDLSGASNVKISGTASKVATESSGASDVKGYELVTETCTAKASGASDINITVNKELNVQASGASDIYYKGAGVIRDIHTSGASTVARKS